MTNSNGGDPSQALLRAVSAGDVARVAKALKDGAAVDVQDTRETTRRWTPLMLAAEAGRADLVETLLVAGANVNAADDPNSHPPPGLNFVLREAGLDEVTRSGFKLNRTALMLAADRGHTHVVSALLASGAKINLKDHASCTALHLAARKGHVEIVRALLAADAKIDQRGPNRQTAASLAAERGHLGAVRILLEAGADVTLTDSDRRSVLGVAATCGRAEIVRLLLQALPEGPEKDEVLTRSLTCGVRGDREATAESVFGVAAQLVAAGARVENHCKDGPAPLDIAALRGFGRVVEILLAAGAEADARGAFGSTPLSGAVLYRHLDVVKLLLDHGADPNLRDDDGKSPLDYARERARDEKDQNMIFLLEQYPKPAKTEKIRSGESDRS